jgi:hypothetical protein
MPFEVMKTGEKLEEFRVPSDWIRSRLFTQDGIHREYDRIEYVNGYGANRPRFYTDYCGFELIQQGVWRSYSNGLIISTDKPVYVIRHSMVLACN